MSAAAPPYAQVEAWLAEHRHLIASHLEIALSHLTDLIDSGKRLAAERTALIADRDAETSRADAALKHAAELQAKIDADDQTAASAASDLAAEIAKEAGVTVGLTQSAPSDGDTSTSSTAPVVTTAPSGATITVDPVVGAATHEAASGTTTVVSRDGAEPTATDASGAAVSPAPAAVAEAVAAMADADVTVPAQG